MEARLNNISRDQPIFVIVSGEEPEKYLLDHVRDKLQAVTFFLMTKEDDQNKTRTSRSGAQLLLPLLSPGAEERALGRYEEACEEIRDP